MSRISSVRFLSFASSFYLSVDHGTGEVTHEEAGMNWIRTTIISGAMICCAGCATVTVGPPPEPGGKVAVCHKGKKTIYVGESAVDAHLAHGNYVGRCRQGFAGVRLDAFTSGNPVSGLLNGTGWRLRNHI